jgi:hypothetical protein
LKYFIGSITNLIKISDFVKKEGFRLGTEVGYSSLILKN